MSPVARVVVFGAVALQHALVALGVLLLLMGYAPGAHAQSVDCRHWVTFTTPAFDYHGTQAQACAAYGVQFNITPTACTLDSNGLRVDYGTGNHVYLIDSGASTSCTADPPDDPASGPQTVPMDWANASHLLQALLVACCVLMLVFGINSGNRL